MKEVFTITVRNTMTGKQEAVSVTREVYNAYTRSYWNERYRNHRFYKHEIQFSSMSDDPEMDVDIFHEFVDTEGIPENLLQKKQRKQIALAALQSLSASMRRRFLMKYFDGLTAWQIAQKEGVSEDAIWDSLHRARRNLKKYLENIQKTPPENP